MRSKTLLVIVFFFFGFYIANSQSEKELMKCKVLLENIQEEYNGECVDGLANGSGIAEGIDKYDGKFKNGLPWGKGTYTWENGDYYIGKWKEGKRHGYGKMYYLANDKIVEGTWKSDKLVRERVPAQYKVLYKQNVEGVSITKVDDNVNQVEVIFIRNGTSQYSMPNLTFDGSSGFERRIGTFCGYENVEFPFEAYITYQAWNKLMTVLHDCSLKFTIDTPGSWLVKISY